MNTRVLAVGLGLMVVVGGGLAWVWASQAPPPNDPQSPEAVETLPIPPVPPRIAEGEDYENCMAMLGSDPEGANSFADAWEATGGGEGATHCHALAQIALGNVEEGAAILEKLAAGSHAPAVARATVYGQADQAWLLAGQPDQAFGAATLALSLSSDDPDLLIDRATAAIALTRWDDAVDDLTRALEIDGKRADALVLRSVGWRQTGHLDLAQDDIDRAFALDPENPEAYLERGILRQRRGDRAGAHKDWVEAMALAPDAPTRDLAEQNLALLEAGPDRR
jgi:tetratricopeptide (TPR) repeat protein